MSAAGADFDALVRLHWREVCSMLAAVTRSRATAEDLAQEVFALAWRKGVTPGPGMRAWLREVARRLALNELRRRRPAPISPSELERFAPPAASPGRDTGDFEEKLEALRRCVAELPEEQRELVAWRYGETRPLAAIAEDARQSVGYVKQRLFRLRKRLAECVRRRTGTGDVRRGP